MYFELRIFLNIFLYFEIVVAHGCQASGQAASQPSIMLPGAPDRATIFRGISTYKIIQKNSKTIAKQFKKSKGNGEEKIVLPIALIPMQVLECTTNKRKTYKIFALGSENKFKIYSDY